MKIEEYNLYQFKDLVEYLPYDTSVSLQSFLTDYGITYTISTGSMIEDLFKRIYNRFSNNGLFYLTASDSSTLNVNKKFREWLVKFINEYEKSKEYFETLLNAYSSIKSTIMSNVEATTINEVIFNDTPQLESGVFKDDEYATNYTKTSSTTSSPIKTPIERLKDLQDNVRNLWKDWENVMRKLFIERQEGEIYEEL